MLSHVSGLQQAEYAAMQLQHVHLRLTPESEVAAAYTQ
jgi:hypothetical protein